MYFISQQYGITLEADMNIYNGPAYDDDDKLNFRAYRYASMSFGRHCSKGNNLW